MQEKVKLELNFIDLENKNFKLSIDDPREGLNAGEIKAAADKILETNLLIQNGQGLRELGSVKKTITRTEQVIL